MHANKRVILARPHPFIVAEMAPFLTELGFAPVRLNSVQELTSLGPAGAGAVISLAVGSTIPESAGDIFSALRRHDARVPVAARLQFRARRSCRIGREDRSQRDVHRCRFRQIAGSGSRSFFYVTKSDFEAPARRELFGRMLLRHFC